MAQRTKLPRSRRSTWIFGAVILCFAAFLVWRSVHRTSGSELWLEQKRREGEKFTVAELLAGRAFDTNDCMPAIEAAARVIRSQINRRSGVTSKSLGAGAKRAAWREAQLATYDGWTMDWDSFGKELAVESKSLGDVRTALAQPTINPDWDYQDLQKSVFSRNMSAKRLLAQTLGNAALYELHQYNLAAAQGYLNDLLRLIRVHGRGATLVNQMMRVVMTGVAADALWQALQAPGWTEPELRQLQTQWSEIDLIPDVVTALEMGRATGLAHLNAAANSMDLVRLAVADAAPHIAPVQSVAQAVLGPAYRAFWIDQDKLFYLLTIHAVIESLREAGQGRPWISAETNLQASLKDYRSRSQGLNRMRHALTLQVLPNIERIPIDTIRYDVQHRLGGVALAVKLYQARTGRTPPSLEALASEYATMPMIDPWDGKPLRYRINRDGSAIVYACGPDEKDDGGDPITDMVWELPGLEGRVNP